jgi:hypothetical protein
MRRFIGAAAVVLVLSGFVLAESVRGILTSISDKEAKVIVGRKKGEKGEEKTFKVSDKTKFTKKTKDSEDDLKLDQVKEAIEKSKGGKGVPVVCEVEDGKLTKVTLVGRRGKKKKDTN